MIYNTENHLPKNEHWYIVWLRDFHRITLYPVYFINQVSAKRALTNSFPARKRDRYTIISGKKLRQYELTYTIGLGKMPKFTKYDFPKDSTMESRKHARTMIRRRLRRMGMLIPKKHKRHIKDKKIEHSRLLVNKQKVATSPNTEAKAFRLERMPKRYHYIILSKRRSDKNGIMFRVHAIRYNSKKGNYKELFINIFNKDVIIPYLISQVYALALNKGNYEEFKRFCTEKGLILGKAKEKKVL